MEPRLLLAYSLIALMVVPVLALIAWKRFYSRERVYRRRVERERQIDAMRR